MELRMLLVFLISLLVTVAAGFVLIPYLRRASAGQSIREDGPVWHSGKQGTPVLGGLMFIGGIIVTCLTIGYTAVRRGELTHIFILLFGLVFAAIGFLDDYEKLRKKRNLGLRASHKLALQAVAAVAFVLLLHLTGYLHTSLYVPFFNIILSVPVPVYYLFAIFVIVGTVNAVNITDGVDGLAAGVTIPVALWFAVIAFFWGISSVGIIAAALAGGLLGFLFFNFHPAKVFMGDTGSLFLGGMVCAMAFAMDIPLILVPLGMVYIVEAMSDIIQIVYFKITKGKRVFKMAPIHHHFEMCGWSEYKVFSVFTAASTIFAVISYFGIINKE